MPRKTFAACHVPLDTVNCPTPKNPTRVMPLVTTNRPPVSHTVPVAPASPMRKYDDTVLVPPAIVNVPWELAFKPTSRLFSDNEPSFIVSLPLSRLPMNVDTPTFVAT